MPEPRERIRLFDMPLDPLTMEETVERCIGLVDQGGTHQHVVLNAGKVVLAEKDDRLRAIINECSLVNADGQSVVWAGRMAGFAVPERVAGIDLMERLLVEASRRAWPVFFLGATTPVLEAFVGEVRQTHPGLKIAGSRNGYFGDDAAVARSVRESGARVLFIGMPSPRKEYFAFDEHDAFGDCLVVGVGGSLDVVAGLVTRAPGWMQRAGLEWAYRFAQEPGRMWRRYLIGNTHFVLIAVREIVRARLRRS